MMTNAVSGHMLRRIVLIAAGYVAAWAAGSLAVWWHDHGLSAADQLSMSGMLAFGDTVLFCAVAAPLAIVPTLFVFKSLRGARRFWRLHAIASLLMSLTALVEAVLYVLAARSSSGVLDGLSGLAPVRLLAAPVFLLLYSPGLLRVAAPNRRITLLACVFELCALAAFAVWMVLQYHAPSGH
jgi:hypothetical protein